MSEGVKMFEKVKQSGRELLWRLFDERDLRSLTNEIALLGIQLAGIEPRRTLLRQSGGKEADYLFLQNDEVRWREALERRRDKAGVISLRIEARKKRRQEKEEYPELPPYSGGGL